MLLLSQQMRMDFVNYKKNIEGEESTIGKHPLSYPLMGHETKTQRSQSSALGHTASDFQL